MTVYLGTLGRMIPIYSTPSAQLDIEERYSFSTTLEGRRKVQARPIGRRTWGLNAQFADPSEHSLISQFANGAWGPGPFVFVSADAPVTNLLSPSAAACLELTSHVGIGPGGPVDLGPEGWEGSSIAANYPDTTSPEIFFGLGFVPVLHGVPVTGSAYIQGTEARVNLYWYAADLSPLGATPSQNVSSPAGMTRVSVTALPPTGAACCRVVAFHATKATRPALTWTDRAFPWASGEGCPKAVLHGASKNLVMASRDFHGGRYANVSYTITEVG